jgi:Holliday junction resolvase RusA-like endonuclease
VTEVLTSPLTIVIPGLPVAQGRPRAVRAWRTVRVYDPPRARAWKARAAAAYLVAIQAAGRPRPAFDGHTPLRVVITAIFQRPRSGRAAARHAAWRIARPDCDDLAKAALDAANGILWADDAQVADLRVLKRTARHDEPPAVVITVEGA